MMPVGICVGCKVATTDGITVAGVAVEVVGVNCGVTTGRCCFCDVQDEERTTKRQANPAITFDNMALPRLQSAAELGKLSA